jgi:hypothetical protein
MNRAIKIVNRALSLADKSAVHGVLGSKLTMKQTNQLFNNAKRKQEQENV